jgi:hypothetical protein
MTNYFHKLEQSKAEYDLAVYGGTYAYHSVLHHHSFRSMDSTSTLQKKFADKKFSCARTKCESIITNVYAPWALEELKKYLKCVNFVTVFCDTSNHKHMKQLQKHLVKNKYVPEDITLHNRRCENLKSYIFCVAFRCKL